jgi:hypothetical protein
MEGCKVFPGLLDLEIGTARKTCDTLIAQDSMLFVMWYMQ